MSAGAGVLGGDAIPGDLGALDSVASQLRTTAANVQTIQSRVSSNGLSGSWSGRAAEAFRASLGEFPGELEKLHGSFDTAAAAVESFARAVDGYQAQANWLASQIEQVEADRRDAEARQASAQTALHGAEQAHAGAVDPVSQAKAQSEIDHARSAAASTRSEVDEHGTQISKLRNAAHVNHDEYEAAADSCCKALDMASQLGIHNSLFGAIGHVFGEVGGVVAAPFEWVGGHVEHWAEETVNDVATFIDHPSWEHLRKVLEDAKAPLEVAGVGLMVALVVLQPETVVFLPVLFRANSLAQAGIDGVVGVGDVIAAEHGDKEAQGDLAGDAFSVGGDVLGIKGAFGAAASIEKTAANAKGELEKFTATGTSQFKGWATRYWNQLKDPTKNWLDIGKTIAQKSVLPIAQPIVNHEVHQLQPVVTHEIQRLETSKSSVLHVISLPPAIVPVV